MIRMLFNRNRVGSIFHTWHRGWVFTLLFGPGAGHVGGRTLFLAWRSGSLKWLRDFRDGRPQVYPAPWRQGYYRLGVLEFGFTRNANVVPHVSR